MIKNPLGLLLACPATPSVSLGRMSTPAILFSLKGLKKTQSQLHTALGQQYAIRHNQGLTGKKDELVTVHKGYHR
jgi:hypothetical protein